MERGGHRVASLFVTLTYRPGERWEPGHVGDYVRTLRKWLARRGHSFRYQWVAELQTRRLASGVDARSCLHYHLLLWLPHGVRIPKPDSSGQWAFGFSQVQLARRPVGYLVKYASKGSFDHGDIPNGARLFGVGGDTAKEHDVKRARLAAWLAASSQDWQLPKRVTGVGFVCFDSGEVFRSPFFIGFRKVDSGWTVIIERRLTSESADQIG